MDPSEVQSRFAFYPARTLTVQQDHASVRKACADAARVITALCPEGREQSLAITKLEEAMMWGNAAIARAGEAE